MKNQCHKTKEMSPMDSMIAHEISSETGIRDIQLLVTDEVPTSIGHGSKKCRMFSGVTRSGTEAVIKAAFLNTESSNEISNNFGSYLLAMEHGVNLFPGIIEFYIVPLRPNHKVVAEVLFLAMERAGTPVYRYLERSEHPMKVYDSLYGQLYATYEKTLSHDPPAGRLFIERRFTDLERYFGGHLKDAGFSGDEEMGKILALRHRLLSLRIESVALTTGGEMDAVHVFFSKEGKVTLIDPKPPEQMMGFPQHDLAIFGTLVKEVYHLRDGDYGYQKAKETARRVGSLQGISQEISDALFIIGEIRLLATAARFRVGVHDDLARKYADMAKQKLNQLYYSSLERQL